MASLTKKLKNLLLAQLRRGRPSPDTAVSSAPVANGQDMDENDVRKLLTMLEKTREVEYTCAEAFAQLDEFVELVVDDEEAAALMPLVQHHVDMCPDCRDKFEALLQILKTEPSLGNE